LHAEVKIHIEWSIHEQDRHETDSPAHLPHIGLETDRREIRHHRKWMG
jgi:hypothetical protein